MEQSALQHLDWVPDNACFGCGPHNPDGIRIESRPQEDGSVVALWRPRPEFAGPPGVVNGGMVAVPMDCHGNWTAMRAFRRQAEADGLDTLGMVSVTGEYAVRLHGPTPVDAELVLRATVDELDGRRARVTVTTSAEDEVTATFRGTFFRVLL